MLIYVNVIAQLRSFGFGSLVYEGDLAKFECKQHNIYMLHIDWLLNNVSRRDTNYKTVDELEYEKNRGFLVVYTSSEIDTLKVQCKVIQRMNYYYISDPVYLRVQGKTKFLRKILMNNFRIFNWVSKASPSHMNLIEILIRIIDMSRKNTWSLWFIF